VADLILREGTQGTQAPGPVFLRTPSSHEAVIIELGTCKASNACREGCCCPSAPSPKCSHDFPARLTEEDFRADDVGASLEADGAENGDRAADGFGPAGHIPATADPLAPDHHRLLALRGGHTVRLVR
jgi:hypothetical protein